MKPIRRGRYQARLAETADDLRAALHLRQIAFRGGLGDRMEDADCHDLDFAHMLVEDRATDELVCCYRFLLLDDESKTERSYAARFYDLSALACLPGPKVELGRFCSRPGLRDPDVLRLAWAAMTRFVDARGAVLLFGCASFPGADAAPHEESLALLGARHLAPDSWRPGERAVEVVPLPRDDTRPTDERSAMQKMPGLLRSYLQLGGRVSDHAVIDRDIDTLHVFIGVEPALIPPARKRLLRALVD